MPIPAKRTELIGLIRDPAKQREYRRRGKASVPGGHSACAATASQPLCFDLHVIKHVIVNAEMLSTALKQTRLFIGIADLAKAMPGDLVVCKDMNGRPGSDHVWFIVHDLGGGWYECLDNQGRSLTYRRRLDGADGKTPARGLLRLTI